MIHKILLFIQHTGTHNHCPRDLPDVLISNYVCIGRLYQNYHRHLHVQFHYIFVISLRMFSRYNWFCNRLSYLTNQSGVQRRKIEISFVSFVPGRRWQKLMTNYFHAFVHIQLPCRLAAQFLLYFANLMLI